MQDDEDRKDYCPEISLCSSSHLRVSHSFPFAFPTDLLTLIEDLVSAVLLWDSLCPVSLSTATLLPTVATSTKPWTSSCSWMTRNSWRKHTACQWAGLTATSSLSHERWSHQPHSAVVSFSAEEIPKATGMSLSTFKTRSTFKIIPHKVSGMKNT